MTLRNSEGDTFKKSPSAILLWTCRLPIGQNNTKDYFLPNQEPAFTALFETARLFPVPGAPRSLSNFSSRFFPCDGFDFVSPPLTEGLDCMGLTDN